MSFDDIAKVWDNEKRIARAKVISDEIINSLYINKDCSAMEFGCGTGLISFNLYDKFNSIALVDSSKGMIEVLNSKIRQYKVDNMIPYELDITDGKLLDMKFDVIYNSMVLHHIKDTEDIIKKFYQMLNPGGQVCVIDLDMEDGRFHKKYSDFDGHNGFEQESLRKILTNTGFSNVESKTFFYDEKVVEGEKINYSLFFLKGTK